jgi:hypothetical protein
VPFSGAESILRAEGRSLRSIEEFEQRALTLADEHIVLVSAPFFEQWEYGARRGPNLWQLVDVFITGKRRGDINRACWIFTGRGDALMRVF